MIGPSHFQLSTGLQLQNVGRNDSGTYECLVENLLGMASTTATVRVEGEGMERYKLSSAHMLWYSM